MSVAIALRADFTASDLRRIAKTSKDAARSRRLLSLAVIYDGGSRSDAARIGGVGLQVIRDWVLRFNADGAAGLLDRKAPGKPAKLDEAQRQALAAIVERGPEPDIDSVVRWRLVDLKQWIWRQFAISLDERNVGRTLKAMGFVKLTARPRHQAQEVWVLEAFKKTSPPKWRKSGPNSRPTPR
jgi:transposase